jgi:methanogenic corrinoid protein MtbC1
MQNIDEITQQFVDTLLGLDARRVCALLTELKSGGDGLLPLELVVVPALERIGRAWEEGRVSLSQVYMAGRICEQAMAEMLPADRPSPANQPRLAIGVLLDYHALGKRMVNSALHSAGFHLLDYGHGLRPAQLVEMALRDRIDMLLISCLMLASALRAGEVVTGLRQAGSQTAVVVGGAPFRLEPELWKKVGAQAMGRNSVEAVKIVQSWMEEHPCR